MTDPRAAQDEIRAARARSNAAIAARDVAGMKALFLPNSVVLPGATGEPAGYDDFDARMTRAFADPDFAGWVRTPDTITVSRQGSRAAESGHWVGAWNTPDGEVRVGGVYLAMWLPTPVGWRLKNESFVTLD